MIKALVVGLDAATFDVIGPWIEDGTLPNLQALVREGASGPMRSTLHPNSPVAWTSAVTGKFPGKHGVFDWRARNPRTYHADLVNAQSVNSATLWQFVNAAGRPAGVINVPVTYPPRPLDGYMVSGILTPRGSASFTYPPELMVELHQVADGYQIFFGRTYQEGEEQLFLDAIHCTVEKRGRAVLHLLKTRPTDFTMVVFMESDHIQHDLWKYMDTDYPGYRPEYVRYQYAIRDMFVALDGWIGQMRAVVPDDTTIFVMSDHGAGPLYKVVYIDKYLIQRGLMRLKASPLTRLKQWILMSGLPARGYEWGSRFGIDVRQLVPREKRAQMMNAGLSSADIDWARTKAYSCGDQGQIAVNLQGRERFGSVPPEEYEAVRYEVIAALRELCDPETDKAVVDDIYRREEIYDGPYVNSAPDILFSMKGYSYVTARNLGLESEALMGPPRFGRSGNSGSHTMDGIFVARGPHIQRSYRLDGARIVDLAPTVLYAMGLPVPDDMDGRVLTEIFNETYLVDHPVQWQRQAKVEEDQLLSDAYSDEEADEVRRRLEGLGYLG